MEAQTLNCPMCGASASTDATKCLHCGSRLATIACPSCFGMMFVGAKFCSHCGAKAARKTGEESARLSCPRCRNTTVDPVRVGKTELRECSQCQGVWVDTEAMQRICEDREQQAAVLGTATPIATSGSVPFEKVTYRPCPVCRQLMHRMNFARCSQVVVDVCRAHGTWCDEDELRRIVEFIRTGGFEKVRALDKAELQRERAKLRAERVAAAYDTRTTNYSESHETALAAAAGAVVASFFDL